MTPLWNVWADSMHGSCRLHTVYRVLGLVYLIVCGMAAVELATAQDDEGNPAHRCGGPPDSRGDPPAIAARRLI